MTPNHFSLMWASLAPKLGNHLWQSTLFAVVAGLLAFVLRRNHARTRYSLWLSASVKFLLPFSVLVGVGSALAWSESSVKTGTGLYVVARAVSQPFTQRILPIGSEAAHVSVAGSLLVHWLPMLILTMWLCGFLSVLAFWFVRWNRISNVAQQGLASCGGRELEILRRVERASRTPKPIEMRISQSSLEPGIFGIFRPVLVWPKGITSRLGDSHLEAILAHELFHVHRRDNLAGAVQMFVEAAFWFYPPVWWIGRRLLDERERACDEAVLELGVDRNVYAEGILKICKYCVESPVNCVSGVTGADLKKRISHIVNQSEPHSLDFSRKLLISLSALLMLVVPVAFGLTKARQTHAQSQSRSLEPGSPAYAEASVELNKAGTEALKTGGIVATRTELHTGTLTTENVSLLALVRLAYGVEDYQVEGFPEWLSSNLYDVNAKAEKSVIDEIQKLDADQRQLQNQRMLQALLKDRFKLSLRHVTKNLPIYSLVVVEAGKLHEDQGDCVFQPSAMTLTPSSEPPCGGLRVFPWVGRMDGVKVPLPQLVSSLSGFTKTMVLDHTNLDGKYDIDLKWFPGPTEFPPRPAYLPATYQPDPNSPPLREAIQQQLGLKLEPQTGPVPLLIIDHVEIPSGD
jgi:bla regulator protein blaR1